MSDKATHERRYNKLALATLNRFGRHTRKCSVCTDGRPCAEVFVLGVKFGELCRDSEFTAITRTVLH